jgi:hypothetical protein
MAKMNVDVSESGLVGRFTVTVTMSLVDGRPMPMQCEWMPRVPKKGEITQADLRTYQAVRNKALARFTGETGLNIALIE